MSPPNHHRPHHSFPTAYHLMGFILPLILSIILAGQQSIVFAQDAAKPTTKPAEEYFGPLMVELKKEWPKNRRIHLVFHGHSVPAGYFVTPQVRTLDAYPHLVLQKLCERFPTAMIDVSVTAIGGENSEQGAARFAQDVLASKPDVVWIDYALNDRRIGLGRAEKAWRSMIEASLAQGCYCVLLTPTLDLHETDRSENAPLMRHAKLIRDLAEEYRIPCVDSFETTLGLIAQGPTPIPSCRSSITPTDAATRW